VSLLLFPCSLQLSHAAFLRDPRASLPLLLLHSEVWEKFQIQTLRCSATLHVAASTVPLFGIRASLWHSLSPLFSLYYSAADPCPFPTCKSLGTCKCLQFTIDSPVLSEQKSQSLEIFQISSSPHFFRFTIGNPTLKLYITQQDLRYQLIKHINISARNLEYSLKVW
jgi:hypothetical protein